MVVLVTGSEGLIGREICKLLTENAIEVKPFDIARTKHEDIRNHDALTKAARGVKGVLHLAAISRVVWGEREPDLCKATNVDALRSLLEICVDQPHPPWVIFVSSREVYGNASQLPVREDAPLSPLNVYARSKWEGEKLVMRARDHGLCANVCRLSNVYGSTRDHPDRVVPAFASVAAHGGRMQVEGSDNLFDFTSVADVGRALQAMIESTGRGERLPPVHFASGVGTTLGQLAHMAKRHARAPVEILEAPKRDFDAHHFVGDPERARRLFGWHAEVALDAGVRDLVDQFVQVRLPAASESCLSQAG